MPVSNSFLWVGALLLAGLLAACGSPTRSPDAGARDGGQVVIVPRPAEVIAGEALAFARGCSGCHSSPAGLLAGSASGVGGGSVYGSNITPDPSTGIGAWTDEDIVRALRFGVDDEGVTLCSEMPREPNLSDQNAALLVAYLRSVPPVESSAPSSTCTPRNADRVTAGRVLSRSEACNTCHGEDLGGNVTPIAGSTTFAPNLTPDPDTGLGNWSREQLLRAIQSGVDDEGVPLCETMPRFAALEDEQLESLVAFLQSLAPVVHTVPSSICAAHEVDAGVVDAGVDAGVVDAGVVDAGTTCSGTATVVVAQVYGGGGNTGAVFKNDFVELHNRTARTVDLTGWALQYASAAGTSWTVAAIPAGTTLAPGAFVVFSLATSGTPGMALPAGAIALTPPLNLSSSTGKLALTRDVTPLSTTCPLPGVSIEDFVGFGTSATCSEGTVATGSLSVTSAAVRVDEGGLSCGDTGSNQADFVVTAPAPRQAPSLCGCP